MNLRQMLEKAANRYGEKTLISLGDRKVSYTEVDEASNKIANALISLGVRKGDRVAMLLPNSPEFVIIYFGIVKTGAIAVPLKTGYAVDELTSLFDNAQPKVLVTESTFLEPLVPVLPRFKSIERVIDLGSKYEGQFLSYRDIKNTSSPSRVRIRLEPEDIAHIAYTSGPTLHPKGVMLSHQSLVMEASISGDGFKQTAKDIVMLFALPMHHMFGLAIVLLTSINRGSTIIMVPGTGISIGSLMAAIEREKGTILLGVPYIYALAVKMAEWEGVKNDLSSLRLCGSGGAPLSINLIQQFKQHYGFTIADFWGQTEATAQVTCQLLDGTGKLGSVGKALPGWETKIVDDNGKELAPNQVGEIIVRGPIMKGFYNNPQATAELIKDGWLYTRDIGKIDEDGYLYILGWKREMIIAKGQNIYPSDIESVLRTHPKVAEAAVVGIPDELRGEIVRAVISLKEGEVTTEDELRQFCQEHMANYKVPKQLIVLDSLPKIATGEIHKEALKQRL